MAMLLVLAFGLAVTPQHAASKLTQDSNAAPNDAVPAYHEHAPDSDLPATMSPDLFDQPIVQNAYAVAARVKSALYQQPCYCHCDQSHGHKSLLDCFASRHGSGCGTCIYEDFYTYEQTRKGRTPAQIRAGIIKGEWKSVDAAKYQQPLSAK